MVKQLWSLRHDGQVDITHFVALLLKYLPHAPQKHARIGALEARVGVGKMIAYVAQRRSSQKSIAQRMKSHIGIAMPQKPQMVRHFNSTEPQLTFLNKPMNIKTVTDSYR